MFGKEIRNVRIFPIRLVSTCCYARINVITLATILGAVHKRRRQLRGGRGVPIDDMGRCDGGRGKKKSISAFFFREMSKIADVFYGRPRRYLY